MSSSDRVKQPSGNEKESDNLVQCMENETNGKSMNKEKKGVSFVMYVDIHELEYNVTEILTTVSETGMTFTINGEALFTFTKLCELVIWEHHAKS